MHKGFTGFVAAFLGAIMTLCVAGAETATIGKVVRYRDFGAVGDGKTNDAAAIAKAHAYANEHNLPVRAEDDAEYYIGDCDPIIIQTDTDWGRARFTIDDTVALKDYSCDVFVVTSKLTPFTPNGIAALKKNQENIGVSLPQRSMVIVENSDAEISKRYVRPGYILDGNAMTDSMVVASDGKIDPNTPVIWNFDKVTQITAYPIDEQTLTIHGGRFTTLANRHKGTHRYYLRGLGIKRSNTVVDSLSHAVEEGDGESWPYWGFITVLNCADVTLKNLILTGRKLYYYTHPNGRKMTTGTYDLNIGQSVNVSLLNCKQSNSIVDRKFWGIMAINYGKNIVLERCRFSRFDTHRGIFNGTVRNCELGYHGMNIIGSGTFLVENTSVSNSEWFINMRSDYGSTWNGELIIRNCVFTPQSRKHVPWVIFGYGHDDCDFGYECSMPKTITIDGLRIDISKQPKEYSEVHLFSDLIPEWTSPSYRGKFPYAVTQQIKVNHLRTSNGKPVKLSSNPYMFADVKITGSGIVR